jgi:glucose-6-phosphate 1-dehydrogenase
MSPINGPNTIITNNYKYIVIYTTLCVQLTHKCSKEAYFITNYLKMQVLESVLPIKDDDVVLGQYEGYRDDPTVPDNSNTPTFASVILRVHNERWEGMLKA